jgi:hypothetical protein
MLYGVVANDPHLEQLPVVMAGRATVVDQSSAAEDEPRIVVLGGHDRPPRATLPQPFLKPRPPAPGPQLWAVILTCMGLYYLWTRILGRSLPAIFVRGLGQRLVSQKKNVNVRHSEMVAAREKQQRQLQEIANRSTIRERSSVAASSSSSSCNEDDNKT